jgi:hypothetical protein
VYPSAKYRLRVSPLRRARFATSAIASDSAALERLGVGCGCADRSQAPEWTTLSVATKEQIRVRPVGRGADQPMRYRIFPTSIGPRFACLLIPLSRNFSDDGIGKQSARRGHDRRELAFCNKIN